ncbi:MAG: hypothetical protein AB1744_15125, partial [Candidatus Zixiibacteriota bacterium]
MSGKRKHIVNGVWIGLLLLGLFVWSCSNSPLDNQSSPTMKFSMELSSPELIELVSIYLVIVTAPDIKRIEDTLDLVDGQYLVGEVDVPVGRNRTFTVRALDKSGRVIYEGVVVTDVPPPTEVLHVPMQPVVAMVKLSPRHEVVPPGSLIPLEVKAFNIDSLYSISIRIYFD